MFKLYNGSKSIDFSSRAEMDYYISEERFATVNELHGLYKAISKIDREIARKKLYLARRAFMLDYKSKRATQ